MKSLTLILVLVLIVGIASSKKIQYNPGHNSYTADYVVVGTGAGGAPALRLLTDDGKYSAIGLEAGDNHSNEPIISVPANLNLGISRLTYNWILEDVNQAQIGMGRMAGGSTSHNGMQYIIPSNAYFDLLHDYGGDYWLPSLAKQDVKEMEKYTVDDFGVGISAARGTSGLVSVRRPKTGPLKGANSLAHKLANYTSHATGLPLLDDYNDSLGSGLGSFERFQMLQSADGTKRTSSWTAFLSKVVNSDGSQKAGRQLRVFFRATVTKILFSGNRATGVLAVRDGVQFTIYARNEVILGAGVLNAPLLQLSGIGDSSYLNSIGVTPLVNNPNVGQHLCNHISIGLPLSYNATEYPGMLSDDMNALYPGGALLPRWGPSGIINTGFKEFQLLWLPYPPILLVYVVLQRPVSTGEVKIQSPDPFQTPLHNENILSNPADVDNFASFLYYGVQNTILKYISTQDSSYQPLWTKWNNIDEAKAYVTANAGRVFHYSGQTRMATNIHDGVVDGYGRVFGTQNLRVVGAGVMPEEADATYTEITMLQGYRTAKRIIWERTHGFPW